MPPFAEAAFGESDRDHANPNRIPQRILSFIGAADYAEHEDDHGLQFHYRAHKVGIIRLTA